ncbi:unnamed protein product [Ambrosiozyma monospora]|uniref:Unnamed protein product n=1 Tax=Ambrosiozyma monospora TaxID=43982 RepID=A0ACB5T084_AMBMO|nr:unnamed protein product [Ambrosiozyma monospora]
MDRAKQATQKEDEEEQAKKQANEAANRFIRAQFSSQVTDAAVSKVHFEGKHTKFTDTEEREGGSVKLNSGEKSGLKKELHKKGKGKSKKSSKSGDKKGIHKSKRKA